MVGRVFECYKPRKRAHGGDRRVKNGAVTPRQFVNDPRDMVREALAGFERAQRGRVRWNRDPSFVVRTDIGDKRKVGLVSGGGSGHEPLHVGFIGAGMLDAACPGEVFASPTSWQIQSATEAVDTGDGVVHIVKNYTGDVLNFTIAAELAAESSVRVEQVLVDDDLATEVADGNGPGRRGTAAVIAVEKICGALAEQGADLATIAKFGRRVAENSRTMALALTACTHPGSGVRSFELPPDEVEFGVGIHGERGRGRIPYGPSRDLVNALTSPLVDAVNLHRGDRVIVIVNGLGSTHSLELHGIFGEVAAILDSAGIVIDRSLVGPYVTALDMAGASVTLIRSDDDIVRLWDAPVRTAALTW